MTRPIHDPVLETPTGTPNSPKLAKSQRRSEKQPTPYRPDSQQLRLRRKNSVYKLRASF